MGSIEALSGYRRFSVSQDGARGLMAVSPSWAAKIGDGDSSKLFHAQTNLRFGCQILRHYLNASAGNMHAALTKYVGNNLSLTGSNPRIGQTVLAIEQTQKRLARLAPAIR